ncbi:hypothetical protein AZF37_07655 [endosymbiont 'TC1' of Trimyema compressum]|uniref:S1C family serine protease n=1 Tax=endosymbiont 'TC1' of Trimyema compressum TaxID=243899 RepID=UPI0007F099C1|nr:trypsin-like peptidase domain-containing protein [endosymbiont 'TC1' of Trimyema compressum]AMP21054.1 hypothetical protein AZF37_07655 [endosymbiont 'TC1' of Trimyema compressum]
MKNALKLLLAGIIGGLISLLAYQGILTIMNQETSTQNKNTETVHEVKVGENVSIPDVVANTSSTVVQIVNTSQSGGNLSSASIGSGVIIDNTNGYVVTNYHVIEGNGDLVVNLSDGRTTKATRLGGDPDSDIAVIQLEDKSNLKAIKLGDSPKLKVGQTAIAIGSPLGIELANTVTVGVVSALDREISVDTSNGKTILTVLQTDAAINPGNSGGALINSSGELIAINSVKIAASGVEGIGFAIPVNTVKVIADEIIKTGNVSRPQLGIAQMVEIGDAMAKYYNTSKGILVGEVLNNSAAAKAGIQKGDIITKIGDKEITTFEQLKQAIYSHKSGDKVKITLYRNGQTTEVEVTLS